VQPPNVATIRFVRLTVQVTVLALIVRMPSWR